MVADYRAIYYQYQTPKTCNSDRATESQEFHSCLSSLAEGHENMFISDMIREALKWKTPPLKQPL